tara:strand:+ start:1870 stop:2229 length:360 start_codon:yes stop_codon:yes gene_type:complete
LIPITALPLVGLFYCPLITVLLTKSNTPPSKRVTTKEKLYKADNELYKDLCQTRWLALFALKEVFDKITDSDDLHDLEEAVILICRKITDLSIPVDNQIKLMRDRYGCDCDCTDDSSED